MSKRLLLVISGGGALGAYACGAYRAIVRTYGITAIRDMVVVGASAGAMNAAIIARHCMESDGGASMLEAFWHSMARPSVPFFPLPHPYWRRLNGTLTGLVFGNHAAFHAVPGGLLGALWGYPAVSPYRNDPLVATFERWLGDYRAAAGKPRLMVRTVDADSAAPRWFDSAAEPVTPNMIAASSAIPILFPPRWHNGRPLWDGDVWSGSLLPEVLRRLRSEDADVHYHAVSVELVTRHRRMPAGLASNMLHLRDALLGGRFGREPLTDGAVDIPVTRIQRRPHAYEEVSSSLFDWSPDRIDALIEQGERDACAALSEEPLAQVPTA